VTQLRSRLALIAFINLIFLLLALSQLAWSTVYVHWSDPQMPAATSLGVTNIVFTWKEGISSVAAAARKQGYSPYVEAPLLKAKASADEGAKAGWTGVILDIPESEGVESEQRVAELRTTYPKLRFMLLNRGGKPPDMRGSIIVKRNSILEVSSPTAQPWIDTNLALIKVEQRSRPAQVPLYTFSWEDQGQLRTLSSDDYSLAIAEAGAFHADLILQLDENLQQALNNHDAKAWALWNQVHSMLKFSGNKADGLEPAANVAVVVDHLDASDEVLNLLSRHNIPFQVFLAADLKQEKFQGFDVLVMFAKPNEELGERIKDLATSGKTVVVVDAHGSYPWQNGQPVPENEHTTSYAAGNGKILELSEPVTDPEIFAQDIRRLLGKHNSLLSLWNGLTTIAVPYKDHAGTLRRVEFVNYASEPVRVQVQVKGSFQSVRYESPERPCCESLAPVKHDGFTEFVIPELRIAGRIHLEP
jgi:hypothetical protein